MPTSVSTRTSGSLNPTRQQLDELDALLKRMLELPVNQLEEADRTEAESEEVVEEPPPPPPIIQPQATKPAAPPAPTLPSDSVEGEDRVRGVVPSISYMVVETASPRPLPPASGFEPRPSPLTPPQDADEEEPEPPISAAPEPTAEEQTEPEVWVPLCSTWKPSPQTWPPLADSWHQANSAAGMPNAQQESMPREIVLSQPATPPASPPAEPVLRSAPAAEPMVRPSPDKIADKPVPPATAPTSTEPRLSLTAEDAPAVMPRVLLPLLWFNQGFDACMVPLGEIGRWLSGSRGRQMLGLAGLACLAAAAVIALSTGMAWTR